MCVYIYCSPVSTPAQRPRANANLGGPQPRQDNRNTKCPRVNPNPPAKPTLLQYYCTTIAQYTPPHRPPLFMPYTIHYW